MRILLIASFFLVSVGCKGKAKDADKGAPPPEPATSAAPSAPGPAAPSAPTPAAPDDAAVLPLNRLGASVVAPGARLEWLTASNPTPDGFMSSSPLARIHAVAGLTGFVEVSTGAKLGWVPTTLEADLAAVARQGHENVAKAEKNGNWAAAYKLTDSCYLRSWSPALKVWCEASAEGSVGIPCDQVQAAIDVCLSIAARGNLEPSQIHLVGEFPNVKDEKLKEAIVAAGKAVATDDRAAFTALLAPGKIALRKKKVDAAALPAAVEKAGSLSKLMGQECARDESGAQNCLWSSEADGADGKLSIFSHTGYGEVPTIDLARQPDGTWRIAGFGMVDMGEP